MAISQRFECGVDYLTTTWHSEIRDTVLVSTSNIMDWAQSQATKHGKGDWVKPWAWQGYIGYSCGPCQIGERPDGTIVRLSSKAAHDWLVSGFPAGHNISRIDIAMTVWQVYDQSEQIALHSAEAEEKRRTLQHRPFRVRLIDGKGDGDTLYVGSRSSEMFVRIYDKEREQKNEPQWIGAIRYEAECKEELAKRVYERCIAGGYSATNCASVLTGLLARRGVVPLGARGIRPTYISPSGLPKSSIESSLSWLDEQVRPTVRKLIAAGFEREVWAALGIEHMVKSDA